MKKQGTALGMNPLDRGIQFSARLLLPCVHDTHPRNRSSGDASMRQKLIRKRRKGCGFSPLSSTSPAQSQDGVQALSPVIGLGVLRRIFEPTMITPAIEASKKRIRNQYDYAPPTEGKVQRDKGKKTYIGPPTTDSQMIRNGGKRDS